jgi:hypothetical protein
LTPESIISARLANSRLIRDDATMDDVELEAKTLISRLAAYGYEITRRNNSPPLAGSKE